MNISMLKEPFDCTLSVGQNATFVEGDVTLELSVVKVVGRTVVFTLLVQNSRLKSDPPLQHMQIIADGTPIMLYTLFTADQGRPMLKCTTIKGGPSAYQFELYIPEPTRWSEPTPDPS